MVDYLFPDPGTAVRDAVRGLARLYPDAMTAEYDPLFLIAADRHPGRRVGLVAGGGSGHEPLHSGFVGRGGLDAAVPGEIFASPHNRQVYRASAAASGPGGVLHIVKNYTGDRINFGIAAERLRAEGVEVGRVLVDDDIASGAEGTETGRRGTAGAVILEKLLGAAADDGLELPALLALGEDVVARTRTVAAAWRAHTSPGTGAAAFEIGEGEFEYGVGIHGERAVAAPVSTPGEVMDRMLAALLEELPDVSDGVLLLVNGLGSVTQLELAGIFEGAASELDRRGVALRGAMVGTLVAALDMRGVSLTLTAVRPDWLDWWVRPTGAPGFPPTTLLAPARTSSPARKARADAAAQWQDPVMRHFSSRVAAARRTLTAWDQVSGDGDFGDNLARGLDLAAALESTVGGGFAAAAAAFLDDVGGSSGPLFGLLFDSISSVVAGSAPGTREYDSALAEGLANGLAAIQRVGEAHPGDRTMVDALHPAVHRAAAGETSTEQIALAAIDGARATADMRARRGRASYVGDRALGTPDPGAAGIAILLTAVAESSAGGAPAASAGLDALLGR